MNHSGDTNKMVDTPRTDAEYERLHKIYQNAERINGPLCCGFENDMRLCRQLERELNAANQRIKQLEAVVNDPEVLWSNWLRGTVKLPSGIGDVRQYQARIKRLEEARDALVGTVEAMDAWRKAKEAKL